MGLQEPSAGHYTPTLTQDRRNTARERAYFSLVRRAENQYGMQLKRIARHIGDLVRGYPPGDPRIQQGLNAYSKALRPWAEAQAAGMVVNVARRDESAWAKLSREMGRVLRNEVKHAPTGQAMRELMAEQVELITSMPLKAAERVHELTIKALTESTRAREIAKEIAATGKVTASRAMLIARTEVARTASTLTQARAEFIGSEGYIWRTVGDSDVRKLHRKLNGKFIRWDQPPIAGESGERAHAGAIYNCRCYPEPVIPEEY